MAEYESQKSSVGKSLLKGYNMNVNRLIIFLFPHHTFLPIKFRVKMYTKTMEKGGKAGQKEEAELSQGKKFSTKFSAPAFLLPLRRSEQRQARIKAHHLLYPVGPETAVPPGFPYIILIKISTG